MHQMILAKKLSNAILRHEVMRVIVNPVVGEVARSATGKELCPVIGTE